MKLALASVTVALLSGCLIKASPVTGIGANGQPMTVKSERGKGVTTTNDVVGSETIHHKDGSMSTVDVRADVLRCSHELRVGIAHVEAGERAAAEVAQDRPASEGVVGHATHRTESVGALLESLTQPRERPFGGRAPREDLHRYIDSIYRVVLPGRGSRPRPWSPARSPGVPLCWNSPFSACSPSSPSTATS